LDAGHKAGAYKVIGCDSSYEFLHGLQTLAFGRGKVFGAFAAQAQEQHHCERPRKAGKSVNDHGGEYTLYFAKAVTRIADASFGESPTSCPSGHHFS
jgi:hypothetical protein